MGREQAGRTAELMGVFQSESGGSRMSKSLAVLALAAVVAANASAADNLRLNQRLDYSSDSADGPLITGEHFGAGAQARRPNYIIIYGEGCFNSKRQAKRTVDLYEKYKGRVTFVIIDLNIRRSAAQQDLLKKYYQGSIPHVVLLDKFGNAIYNSAGEVGTDKISALLDEALQK
jgi:hypothetical protein